jgi:predicted enzyme related to lactoylglutathione lyase
MPTFTQHAPGTFCWVELATSDEQGAIDFYSELFGWTTDVMSMGEMGNYVMLEKDGKQVGALYASKQSPAPPNWTSYVAVTSADATVEKAKSLGAAVVAGPFDVHEAGRSAFLRDPQGAAFSIWQPGKNIGVDLRDENGTLCWNELMTGDIGAARSFYSQLFEWNVKISTGEVPYTEWQVGEKSVGGAMQMAEMPPLWIPYFQVADCDAAVKKVKSLGGKVHMPPTDIPKVGRISMVSDPQGAMFYVIKLS